MQPAAHQKKLFDAMNQTTTKKTEVPYRILDERPISFARESVIEAFCLMILQEIERRKDSVEACDALRTIGRKALTEFDWRIPAWAKDYENRFQA